MPSLTITILSPSEKPLSLYYLKFPKYIRTPKKFVVITLKVEQDGVSLEGIANSVDSDQTAPLGAV